jgi:hypothetical protein
MGLRSTLRDERWRAAAIACLATAILYT